VVEHPPHPVPAAAALMMVEAETVAAVRAASKSEMSVHVKSILSRYIGR
jgi:hypothetical protein